MPSKYWIKLYQEILHDPKMGMLPDNLWRRTIELFLLAGELSSDSEDERGILPSTKEMAWLLRQSPTTLEQELTELAEVGILTRLETGWLVTNFAKRQEEVKPAERMKQYRQRQRKQRFAEAEPIEEVPQNEGDGGELISMRSVTDDVTLRNADIDIDIDIESDKEDNNATEVAPLPIEPILEDDKDKRPPPPPPPREQAGYTATQRHILALFGSKRFKTVIMGETITNLTDLYGHEKVIDAAKWAAKKGMTLGNAIIALEKALPTWGQEKKGQHKNGYFGNPTSQQATYGTQDKKRAGEDSEGPLISPERAAKLARLTR